MTTQNLGNIAKAILRMKFTVIQSDPEINETMTKTWFSETEEKK